MNSRQAESSTGAEPQESKPLPSGEGGDNKAATETPPAECPSWYFCKAIADWKSCMLKLQMFAYPRPKAKAKGKAAAKKKNNANPAAIYDIRKSKPSQIDKAFPVVDRTETKKAAQKDVILAKARCC